MKPSQLSVVILILMSSLLGCAGMTGGLQRSPADADRSGWASASNSPAGEGLIEGENDSLAPDDTEWLLDSLAVLVDSLLAPTGIMTEVPDISDSLAALTRAQVPSTDELFDYPVSVNHRVLSYIDFFLGRGRKNYEKGLVRSGRYLAMARRTFQEEGIPQDLVFLAHVESAFKVNALSRARALGLWQFMRGTAKLYSLRCDSYVDERIDPEKATRAAARHLRDLHDRYGDWYLALAAYNAGAGSVDRAIKRSGTRDFWELAQTRNLVNETRNFVPAILAATILAKSPGAYGLAEETDPPLSYDTITVDSPIDLRVLARATGTSLAELEQLNPALLIGQTPPLAQKYELHVPLHQGDHAARRLAQIPREERLQQQRHKVRSGENLALIAKRYGTTVRAIQDANRLGRSTLIRTGQTLLVPGRGLTGRDDREELVATGGEVHHRVRRGETLSRIATRYGVSLGAVLKANRLSNPNRLQVGQELTIPAGRSAPQPKPAPVEPVAPQAEVAAEGAGYRVEVLASRTLNAQNNSEALGRVASTAHIVEQARQMIAAAGSVAASPPAEPASREATSSKTGTAEAQSYKVKRGDTLGRIAERFGATVAQLRKWNGLRSGNLIHPGQQLAVSAGAAPRVTDTVRSETGSGGATARGEAKAASDRTHVVRRGESLWRIAKRYGVGLDDILRWNRLSRSSTLRIGQKLVIRERRA